MSKKVQEWEEANAVIVRLPRWMRKPKTCKTLNEMLSAYEELESQGVPAE